MSREKRPRMASNICGAGSCFGDTVSGSRLGHVSPAPASGLPGSSLWETGVSIRAARVNSGRAQDRGASHTGRVRGADQPRGEAVGPSGGVDGTMGVGVGAADGATVGVGVGGAGPTSRTIPLTAMSSPPATSIDATAKAGMARSAGGSAARSPEARWSPAPRWSAGRRLRARSRAEFGGIRQGGPALVGRA